ncbi:MAG: hypothetical protein ABSH03_22125 [Candidatus Lustribacter sp.]
MARVDDHFDRITNGQQADEAAQPIEIGDAAPFANAEELIGIA